MPFLRRAFAEERASVFAFALLAPLVVFWAEDAAAEGAAEPAEVAAMWRQEVRPLVESHCAGCHGPAKRSSALSLHSIGELLAGGDRGPAIDHDNPSASRLVEVLHPDADPHMPPDDQLAEEEIATLQRWVELAAAIEPDALRALAEAPPSSGDDADDGGRGYPSGVAPRRVIDLAVEAGWQDEAITPAPRADDGTFVRRLYLDLLGRVPTFAEREAFLGDTGSDKRDRLIDRLLASPEHARHLSEVFDTVLMGRGPVGVMRRRAQHGWTEFLTRAFAENRPWDETVRQILLARPDAPDEAGASWYLYERKDEHQRIAEAVSAGIFGVDIQCAQCHDHPLADEIEQAHYWGLVAFFNRGENADTPAGPRVAESAVGGFSMFTNLEGESQPNRLVYLDADPVDEPRPEEGDEQEDRDELYASGAEDEPRVPKFSRREQFVQRVLPDHPRIARAMANRLWALLMGRGLVHPVDQLDSTHPPSHPELLDWLADDFARSGYDVRRMLGEIARSDAYQRASEADEFVDPARFAVAAVKPLPAEVLYRAMLFALDVDDPAGWQTPERLGEIREAFPDVLAESSIATVDQALLLTNGALVHELVSPEHSGTLTHLLELSEPDAVAEAAFVRILGRAPEADERRQAVGFLEARTDQEHRGIDQLVWSLVTSAEFRFSH